MRGKKIGITRLGSSTHSVTLWVMNKAGFKPEDYQMLQLVDVPNIFTAIVGRPDRRRRAVAADQFSRP